MSIEHIRTTKYGDGMVRVTITNGKDEYLFTFNDGERGCAQRYLREGEYRGLPTKGTRFVKGQKSLWEFAEKHIDD